MRGVQKTFFNGTSAIAIPASSIPIGPIIAPTLLSVLTIGESSIPLTTSVNSEFWIAAQKAAIRNGMMNEDKQQMLASIGVVYGQFKRNDDWQENYNFVKAYVQILVNRKEKKLLLKPCDEIEITGYRWGRTKDGKRYPSQRTGELFVLTLCEIMDWNPDYRYKVLGKMVQANGKALIAFDLTSSECFPKVVNRDGKKVSSRQSVFAEQWSGKFGPTYSESRRSLAVKTFDNYTVITVNEKKTEVHPQAQPQQQGSMGDSL